MTPAPIKPTVSLDALEKLDVRVGTIECVSDVPGADQLCQLRVNFGDHTRIIVAGIKKERPNPREIEGKQALFVVNLEPRKMRGVRSEGILFDIGYSDGITPVLAMPEKTVPNGARAG
jgi:tRNA-binding protein